MAAAALHHDEGAEHQQPDGHGQGLRHRHAGPGQRRRVGEDSAALAGLLVAFAGVALYQLTGNPLFDAGASIVIGLILGGTALWLAFETKGLLIGESANREVVAQIRRLAERYPEVERVNEVLTMHMGPEYILANISVNIACDVPRTRAHAILDELDARIKKADPRVKRVFIESQNVC